MGETEDRKRDARVPDEEIKRQQVSAVDVDRDERHERLAGQSQTPVGGNLPGEIELENGKEQQTSQNQQ